MLLSPVLFFTYKYAISDTAPIYSDSSIRSYKSKIKTLLKVNSIPRYFSWMQSICKEGVDKWWDKNASIGKRCSIQSCLAKTKKKKKIYNIWLFGVNQWALLYVKEVSALCTHIHQNCRSLMFAQDLTHKKPRWHHILTWAQK